MPVFAGFQKHGDPCRGGHKLTQELQPLRHQLLAEEIDAGRVAAGPGEAGDQTEPHGVFGHGEHDRNRGACRLGRERRNGAATGNDHSHRPTRQFACQLRQPIGSILGPAKFDHDILALDEARLPQALAKCAQAIRVGIGRSGMEEADHRHCWLLRARRERPRRRTAEQRDELAPSHHSITSSARTSKPVGNVSPRAFAVARLITSSNLVGCWTGRADGFSPFRMRSI